MALSPRTGQLLSLRLKAIGTNWPEGPGMASHHQRPPGTWGSLAGTTGVQEGCWICVSPPHLERTAESSTPPSPPTTHTSSLDPQGRSPHPGAWPDQCGQEVAVELSPEQTFIREEGGSVPGGRTHVGHQKSRAERRAEDTDGPG